MSIHQFYPVYYRTSSYILIHDAILEFIMCGNTQIAAGNFLVNGSNAMAAFELLLLLRRLSNMVHRHI